MKQRFFRLLALLVALSAVMSFVACGGGGETQSKPSSESESQSGSESEGTDWSQVNFGGEELHIEVSANQDYEVTFPPADIYTRGPDALNEEPVQKKVYDRNRTVASTLGLDIVFSETDLRYDGVLEDMQKKVQLGSADAPDIYINDAYGIARAMMNNLLINVANPTKLDGSPEESYFDFTADCWYQDYMLGMTFTPEKQYVLAGDYDLDLIRMAWVYYVNLDLLDETLSGAGYDREYVYEMVRPRIWDIDTMMYLAETAHTDSVNYGTTDKDDDVVGMTWPHVFAFVFTPSSGIGIMQLDEDGKPYVPDSNAGLFLLAEKLTAMYNTMGVYWENDVLNSTVNFMNGNIIFAMSVLGEMESEDMRKLPFSKGVVPFPIFDMQYQQEYNTITHDQSEVTCILNTTDRFTEASAYLQMINELSSGVLHEYYENTLKLRYNDDPDCRDIIDIIHDTIASPRAMVFTSAMYSASPLPSTLKDVTNYIKDQAMQNNTSFSSNYESAREAWEFCFQAGYDIFMELD